MKSFTSYLDARCRVVIPKSIRDSMELTQNTQLEITCRVNEIIIKRADKLKCSVCRIRDAEIDGCCVLCMNRILKSY